MSNNFNQLEEELISKHGEPPTKIKKNIDGSINLFKSFGDIIELFVPNLLELVYNLLGGSSKKKDN